MLACSFFLASVNIFSFFEIIWPAMLKTLSEGELEAHMHRYFFAKNDKCGKTDAYYFHLLRGLESASGFRIFSLSNSFMLL